MIYRCCTKQSYWENTNFNKPKKLGIYQPHVVIHFDFQYCFGRSGNIRNIIQVLVISPNNRCVVSCTVTQMQSPAFAVASSFFRNVDHENIWMTSHMNLVIKVFKCGPSWNFNQHMMDTIQVMGEPSDQWLWHAVTSNNFWSSLEIFLLTSPFQQDPQTNETTYHNHSQSITTSQKMHKK